VRVTRARAWTDIATTYAREDDHRQAAEAYRRAYRAAPGTSASHNALFALGQMRLSLNESDAAAQVFREYVFVAPEGALSSRARRSLCTLGDRAYCP
jgi:predicted TPR repeat methyltransferase